MNRFHYFKTRQKIITQAKKKKNKPSHIIRCFSLPNNRQKLLSQLKVSSLEDLYNLTTKDFVKNGVSNLLRPHKNSVYQTVSSLFPEFNWHPWKFRKSPLRFWKRRSNQRQYLEWLSNKLRHISFESWYDITKMEFTRHGGKGLLNIYNCSPVKAITTVYAEYPWKIWRFYDFRSPKGTWSDPEISRDFLNELGSFLGVKEPSDWYRISSENLVEFGGVYFVKSVGSLFNALKYSYPEFKWDALRFKKKKRSNQWRLWSLVRELFPGITVLEDYSWKDWRFGNSGRLLRFDIFVPELNLALEYHGFQHYNDHYNFGSFALYHERDRDKRWKSKTVGITLIEIPFWSSLATEDDVVRFIGKDRPDLLPMFYSSFLPGDVKQENL